MIISAIIITHNRKAYLSDLLDSLLSGTRLPDEIIVIDNASTDDTLAHVRRVYPAVEVIESESNLLVSGAANLGFERSRGDLILLIADDNVFAPDCVEELERCAERHPEAGIIGPTMYYYDAPKRLWFQGVSLNILTSYATFRQTPYRGLDDALTTDCVPNCFAITRQALEKVRGLDAAAFPMHHEEADLCMRCRRFGFAVYVSTRAREWHRTPLPGACVRLGSGDFSVDNPTRAYFHARARVFFAKRYAHKLIYAIYLVAFMPPFTLAYAIVCLFINGAFGTKTAAAFLKGTIAGIFNPVPAFDGLPITRVVSSK